MSDALRMLPDRAKGIANGHDQGRPERHHALPRDQGNLHDPYRPEGGPERLATDSDSHVEGHRIRTSRPARGNARCGRGRYAWAARR